MINAKAAAACKPALSMVDELGDLEKELAPFKPKIARVEAIRKALRDKYREEDSSKTFTLDGLRWQAVLGPCGNASEISVRALFKAIGVRKFLELATISIKAATAAVPAEILSACMSVSQTGSRQLTVVPRGK